MFSFDKRIASRGYHVYRKSSWKNAKAGQRVKVEKETRETSRHYYFFMKKGSEISGYLVSSNYKPSPIPAGRLEVPLLLTLSVKNEQIFEQMKEFVTTLYDDEYTGMKEGESEDEDGDDGNVIEVKLNDREGQTGPVQTTIELEGKES